MIVADKTLDDSVLSVTFFKIRNKPATKLHEKSRTMAALSVWSVQGLHYTSSMRLPNASAMRLNTSMLVA